MGLPPLYYDGCDNPPHPEVRIDYFLHMVKLYSSKAVELVDGEAEGEIEAPFCTSAPRRRIRSYVLAAFSLANRDTILSCIVN